MRVGVDKGDTACKVLQHDDTFLELMASGWVGWGWVGSKLRGGCLSDWGLDRSNICSSPAGVCVKGKPIRQ